MNPFNKYTRGILMAAAPVNPGGGNPDVNLPPPQNVSRPPTPQPDPEIQRLSAELNRNRADTERLRQMVMSPPPPSATASDKRELEKEFIRQPLDMSAAIANRVVNERLNAALAPAFETNVAMARQLARQGNEELWDRYSMEIEAAMAQVEPQSKQNTTMWKNAASMVIGGHIAEIRTAPPENRSAAVHIREGGGPAAPSKSTPPVSESAKLTDQEVKWAKRFRITPEQYAQGKEDNLKQSDEILDPVGPSSWDKHITFSTKDRRRKEREARAKGK